MARLMFGTPTGEQALELRPFNGLGRHPSNSIQLMDKIASKEHCVIEQRGPAFILRDLGSLNGTFVNGQRITGERILRHGDEIELGMTKARFDDGVSARTYPRLPVSPEVLQQQSARPAAAPYSTGPIPGGMPGVSSPSLPAMVPAGLAPPGTAPPRTPLPGMNPYGSMPPRTPPPEVPAPGIPSPSRPAVASGSSSTPPAPISPGPPPPLPPRTSLGTANAASGIGRTAPLPAIGAPSVATPSPMPRSLVPPAAPPAVAPRPVAGANVELLDSARPIGAQRTAQTRGFLPFEEIERNPQHLRQDYEQLRLIVELTRELVLEHDLDKLLRKILKTLFRCVNADRGVILLIQPDKTLKAAATHRRDGSNNPIRLSSTILGHVMREKASVLTADAAGDFGSMNDGRSMVLHRISSAIAVPLLHEGEVHGVLWLDSELVAQFTNRDLDVVTSIAGQAAMFIANARLEKQVARAALDRERLSRLLSPNVAAKVLSGELEVTQGGTFLPECTVFNSDIRGFTRMSEGISPNVMIDMLNEYFELMVAILFRHEGTLDKFMGDGIMALFGAPEPRPDDPARSVRCALEMMGELARFNRDRSSRGIFPFEIGIGIHSGPLVAGNVGSSKSLSYTVIGDTANTSARLCSIAMSGQIVVSEYTANRIGSEFELEELPPAHLKGKEKPLRIFNVRR